MSQKSIIGNGEFKIPEIDETPLKEIEETKEEEKA